MFEYFCAYHNEALYVYAEKRGCKGFSKNDPKKLQTIEQILKACKKAEDNWKENIKLTIKFYIEEITKREKLYIKELVERIEYFDDLLKE